nr:multicopper oxidase family protein [Tateyamaria omphalii]
MASASALTVLPHYVSAEGDSVTLRAEPVTAQVLPEGEGLTEMLGFNGSMPGPEIRAVQGQPISINVENGLDEGTSVHWHGIRLDNHMDGVPILTQDLIDPGDTKTYSFVPPDGGTYWYHSHYISHEQVARGMAGPLIVAEDTPPDVDDDITAILADWRLDQDGRLTDEFTDMHSVAHAGYMGNFARAFLSQATVRIGDRIRLRLINAATNRIFPLELSGATGVVVALDGMPLAEPRPFAGVVLAPAQRADLILDVSGQIHLEMPTRQGPYNLAKITVDGTNNARRAGAIVPLSPHNLPKPSEPTQHLVLTMMGGAMGGRHGGDNIWAFNNVSDLQPEPFGSFERGETAQVTLVNDTSFPHGIHLHGHHFYEVAQDGSLGDLRDTTLVEAGESRDIICVFDNPGRWMLHCHMLSHTVGGMRTWVNVA